ncbi:MAG TPA: M48 family metalloprotease [Pyrinomonadaceae bacterium]|nr:M48 family metalloprotease [Pyrinomonadaceae bacterium]
MYELLGICLALTALLVVNSLASWFFAAICRLCEGRLTNLSAHTRAEILFGMRALPPALALICAGMLVIPAYVAYEPHVTSEIVSTKLGMLALFSAAGLVFALWRAYRSWSATRSLLRGWLRVSERIDLHDLTIPTFRIEHSFPIIAVVGSVKPRLFVASSVLEALTKEELAAAIAHERGHLMARDNLKRLVLRACRDVLMLVPFGRPLDRDWAQAAEAAADEHAARENPDRALNLASALVKIAKMVPIRERAEVPLGAYLIGAEETQGVKARIRRLLDIASDGIDRRDNRLLIRTAQAIFLIGSALFGIAAASNPRVLMSVHEIIEHTVALLC